MLLEATMLVNLPRQNGFQGPTLHDLAGSDTAPDALLLDLLRGPNVPIAKRVADRVDLPAEGLAAIVSDVHHTAGRLRLALNCHTPAEVLAILAHDDAHEVRAAARRNPNFDHSRNPADDPDPDHNGMGGGGGLITA